MSLAIRPACVSLNRADSTQELRGRRKARFERGIRGTFTCRVAAARQMPNYGRIEPLKQQYTQCDSPPSDLARQQTLPPAQDRQERYTRSDAGECYPLGAVVLPFFGVQYRRAGEAKRADTSDISALAMSPVQIT